MHVKTHPIKKCKHHYLSCDYTARDQDIIENKSVQSYQPYFSKFDEQIEEVLPTFNLWMHIRPFSGCMNFKKHRILRFLGNGMGHKMGEWRIDLNISKILKTDGCRRTNR